MKILMISSEPQFVHILPELNVFTRDWDQVLSSAGHEVVTINLQKIFLLRYIKAKGLTLKILRDLNALSLFPNWTFLSGLIFCIKGLFYYRTAAKKYDLIICHNSIWAGILGFLLNMSNQKRLIIVEHNINKTLKNESWLHQKLLKWFFKYRTVDVLCLNSKHASLYSEIFNLKVDIIANPVDAIFCDTPVNHSGLYDLISVGSLDNNKGQLFQLEIIKQLPSEYTLTIVGDGPLLNDIKRKIVNLNLSDRVIMTGSITRRDVRNLMDRHAIFINTSISETFGVVNTEAGCRGLFVISSNNGGVWNSTLDCNRIVIDKKRDVTDWVNAIFEFQSIEYDRLQIGQSYQDFFSNTSFIKGLKLR